MSLVLTGLGLLASGLGTGISAFKNAQNNDIAEDSYSRQQGRLLTDLYVSPYDRLENRALLTQADRRIRQSNKAIDNQAAAGGATFENTLAAKQKGNEAMADIMVGMAQTDGARKDSIRQQLLNLDSQRTAQRIAANQASGQMWATLGNNVSDAFSTLGGTMLETGTSFADLLKFK
jgi:hypothetical protein